MGRTQPANSNFLLFHISKDQPSCPASVFLSFYSTHMFLFKASSAGDHDWCAPPPLPSSLSNNRFPAAAEGGLSSQPHCSFSRGKLPHSSTRQTPPPTASDSCLSPFSFASRIPCGGFHSCNGQPIETRCTPSRHLHRPPSFSLIPPVVHHAFAAGWRLAQLYGQLGQCSRGMSLPSDWSGGSVDGNLLGTQQNQQCGLWESFTWIPSRQVADGVFLPPRDRKLRAYGAGAVRGCS